MAVKVDSDKCNACGSCMEACPTEALGMGEDCVIINSEACIDCGVCVDECPSEALSLD